MLETTSFEEITQIRMSREIGGKPVYWVAAYLVDGLLIDTGCSYTAGELASFFRDSALPCDRLILFTSVGRIVEEGRQAMESCIRYLEDLSARTKALESKGLNIAEIIQRLFGGAHGFAQLTNGQYTTENLIRSVLKMRV